MSVLSRDGRAREIRLQQDDDVIQVLALAREYAAERVFGGGRAHASTAQIDKRLGLIRASGVGHLAGRVFGPVL
ncbi:MAG TPA: hypothetical protein VK672_05250 [Solirubrobacteraceae bacterium]|jgi:hypothetical protein|nr:hypothetical protein [Solirubrobacteraceae bacterium]